MVSVGRMVCHSSSGKPVGWSACGMVCLWDGLPVAVDWWPVVSNLDTLPACEGVAVVSVGRMVSLWPVVVSFLGAGCLCRMVCHSSSGEGVGWSACVIGCRCQFPRWCWLSVSDGVPQFQR